MTFFGKRKYIQVNQRVKTERRSAFVALLEPKIDGHIGPERQTDRHLALCVVFYILYLILGVVKIYGQRVFKHRLELNLQVVLFTECERPYDL